MALNVSFYLLTPKAKSQSLVYVSILKKELGRLRFATDKKFIASYCNSRTGKHKELVKKNTVMYFDYSTALKSIETTLIQINNEFEKLEKPYTLEQIKNEYYLQIGKIKPKKEIEITFEIAFNSFIEKNKNQWTQTTFQSIETTLNHLTAFQTKYGVLKFETLTSEFWEQIRDNYFVNDLKFSNNTTNKYLKKIRQFLRFAQTEKLLSKDFDIESLDYLDMVEPFKIALTESEVETLANINLSKDTRLGRVRDLFLLEILTGQRYSDIHKVLDKNHISETSIQIYQQKTNEKVNIPLHPKLAKHLTYIFEKYPEGLPILTNQKFNDYLKEVCQMAKFERVHSWVTMNGKTKTTQTDFRYNLISSHTGRRTFATLALKSKIEPEIIMKVTGHRSYDQFREYVKIDDSDVNDSFKNF